MPPGRGGGEDGEFPPVLKDGLDDAAAAFDQVGPGLAHADPGRRAGRGTVVAQPIAAQLRRHGLHGGAHGGRVQAPDVKDGLGEPMVELARLHPHLGPVEGRGEEDGLAAPLQPHAHVRLAGGGIGPLQGIEEIDEVDARPGTHGRIIAYRRYLFSAGAEAETDLSGRPGRKRGAKKKTAPMARKATAMGPSAPGKAGLKKEINSVIRP